MILIVVSIRYLAFTAVSIISVKNWLTISYAALMWQGLTEAPRTATSEKIHENEHYSGVRWPPTLGHFHTLRAKSSNPEGFQALVRRNRNSSQGQLHSDRQNVCRGLRVFHWEGSRAEDALLICQWGCTWRELGIRSQTATWGRFEMRLQ